MIYITFARAEEMPCLIWQQYLFFTSSTLEARIGDIPARFKMHDYVLYEDINYIVPRRVSLQEPQVGT